MWNDIHTKYLMEFTQDWTTTTGSCQQHILYYFIVMQYPNLSQQLINKYNNIALTVKGQYMQVTIQFYILSLQI